MLENSTRKIMIKKNKVLFVCNDQSQQINFKKQFNGNYKSTSFDFRRNLGGAIGRLWHGLRYDLMIIGYRWSAVGFTKQVEQIDPTTKIYMCTNLGVTCRAKFNAQLITSMEIKNILEKNGITDA